LVFKPVETDCENHNFIWVIDPKLLDSRYMVHEENKKFQILNKFFFKLLDTQHLSHPNQSFNVYINPTTPWPKPNFIGISLESSLQNINSSNGTL